MTAARRSWLVAALVAAVLALIGSIAVMAGSSGGPNNAGPGGLMGGAYRGTGSMMGSGSMLGSGRWMGPVWLAGNGNAVTSIAVARARAAQAAQSAGLHPGEVIWFDNGFYVELKDATGASATEVIVDQNSGAVTTEPGPAMLWNTRYGMHANGSTGGGPVSTAQAQQIAAGWLTANFPGRTVAAADSYPGYYTLDLSSNGQIDGMLSVNASTGAVWYHSWHGRFIARQDS